MVTSHYFSHISNISFFLMQEISRVLRFGGRYICISLLQPHILDYIVKWFNGNGWPVRILRCKEAEENKSPEERIFPVFAVVATKFKKMPNMPTVRMRKTKTVISSLSLQIIVT